MDDDEPSLPLGVEEQASSLLIRRSSVPPGLPYLQYRDFLRLDFFYSCGYCTLSEFEAQAIRFTIDHYEPQSADADRVDEYNNLIYSCDECNVLKNDLCPPASARNDGYRFFRPDHDVRDDHFVISGYRLNALTNIAHFTIEALDLNRQNLRRLRELRARLMTCHGYVASGIMALRKLKIDQVPQALRGRAYTAITNAGKIAEQLEGDIDEVLKAASASPFSDEDGDKGSRRSLRTKSLKQLGVLYPGLWRGRDF